MTDLTHPDLRTRDIFRILSAKEGSFIWDLGQNPESEWECASLETAAYRGRLMAWLHSKEIDQHSEFLKFDESKLPIGRWKWRDLLHTPDDFFGSKKFRAIATDVSWQLEYDPLPIARFGRWRIAP